VVGKSFEKRFLKDFLKILTRSFQEYCIYIGGTSVDFLRHALIKTLHGLKSANTWSCTCIRQGPLDEPIDEGKIMFCTHKNSSFPILTIRSVPAPLTTLGILLFQLISYCFSTSSPSTLHLTVKPT